MDERGFTLTEMLIVIAVIGILTSIAVYGFGKERLKSSIEAQVRDMYTEIVNARLQSFYTKQPRSVIVNGTLFKVIDTASSATLVEKTLAHPVVLNTTNNQLDFDRSGLTFGAFSSACIEPAGNPGAIDSIVISAAKINMGKRSSGGSCGTGTIVQK
ncbi:pilus assembly FimT family protein [Geomobilimonas luticola]|uniref:Prepilin-type N-terminal cleavage/methylation domain-containing protein n=1 Tax=Geomobilimonas luticola TaxID=1114878 RepID=A0ABS5SBS5_9BACT|nr:prepilin-type N-terminal cleavage/methylation domain-containing protein [Geomobilimonas luticola]MBT0652823.1 prepilin-type N-terminal cleavage/methylation domain-containing protein [Geomobilimonas luticola]